MSANSFGLLNSLAAILNSQRRDSDYAIARYLIERLSDINALSITDIMENAFVTRSMKTGLKHFIRSIQRNLTKEFRKSLQPRMAFVIMYKVNLVTGVLTALQSNGAHHERKERKP